jgi:hypothetical protein
MVGSIRENPIVAPAADAGKFGDRHQFDMGDAQADEMIEALNRARKGAAMRKSPQMKFVKKGRRERTSLKMLIGPPPCAQVDQPGRAPYALRLKEGPRVGTQ